MMSGLMSVSDTRACGDRMRLCPAAAETHFAKFFNASQSGTHLGTA